MMADDLNMRLTHLMVSIPPFHIQIKQWSRRTAGITGLTALMSLAVHIATLGYVGADAAPTSMHHEAWLLHRDQPTQPALIGSVDLPQPLSLRVARAARAGRAVRVAFGFLPYWIDADYYDSIDFDLLTHIAPFSVEVNRDGSLGDDHGWPWTALVDRAHQRGVRVILTATLFGDEDVGILLENEVYRSRFMRQIRDKIREGRADGVIIDFEGSGENGWPNEIGYFMRTLTDYLHAEIPGSEVSFASPAIDWSNRWDFAEIASSCDYLFVMGYAFSGSWSGNTGPTAPLTGPGRTIATMLSDDRDYGQVTRHHPEKLILGVPYYGCQWKTLNGAPGASVEAFVNYPRLSDAVSQASIRGRRWDEQSQTAWYRFQDGEQWIQVWFDDLASLELKYTMALDNNWRGFGMWALGYEGRQSAPWQLIERLNGRRVSTQVDLQDISSVAFQVDPLYPNPFNASIQLTYQIPVPGRVQADLYDVLGRRVRSWSQRLVMAGRFTWRWDGRDRVGAEVASGVYAILLRYTVGHGSAQTATRRMVLLR